MPHTPRFALAAALLALAGSAHALSFTARASTHVSPGGPDDAKQASGRAPVSANASNLVLTDGSGTLMSGAALARAAADRAGVHLFAQTFGEVQSSGHFEVVAAQARASGSMGDGFVITSATLPPGSFFAVDIGYEIGAAQNGEARSSGTNAESWSSWTGRFVMTGQREGGMLDITASSDCYTSDKLTTLNCFGSSEGRTWSTVVMAVDNSYAWSIQGDVSSSVLVAQLARAFSEADLSHTLAWGGMRNFRDLQGHALTDIHAWNADRSFDYIQPFADVSPPIPEPASGSLILAGLAVIARLTRRRGA